MACKRLDVACAQNWQGGVVGLSDSLLALRAPSTTVLGIMLSSSVNCSSIRGPRPNVEGNITPQQASAASEAVLAARVGVLGLRPRCVKWAAANSTPPQAGQSSVCIGVRCVCEAKGK
eukprot:6184934-Pleurochrysis_carterae.AAC.2